MEGPYTRYPRATMWLLRSGELTLGESSSPVRQAEVVDIKPFYISKAPITNEQFEAFRPGYERADVSPADEMPAVNNSYEDASAYCQWYSERTGKAFRLPTDAEWEYACRAESVSRYFFGDDPASGDPYLWDARNSEGKLHSIEQKKSNPFGLFEMLGTVWEWTAPPYLQQVMDRPDTRHEDAQQTPRMLRGGSFRLDRTEFGSDIRISAPPSSKRDDIGFRIVRSL